jgi:transposase-like protein
MNCSRTREKKGQEGFERPEPARKRGNKRRGRGTAANGRPPVLGTIGRSSRQVRLRVAADVKKATLHRHVLQFTLPETQVMTDENDSYNDLPRRHTRVSHMAKEWARDDDGDGVREVHTNSAEGLWTGLRAFLRPFRGISQVFLSGYVAIYEFAVNLKRVSPAFIAHLVAFH